MPKPNKNTKRIVFVALVVLGIVAAAVFLLSTREGNSSRGSEQKENRQSEQRTNVERSTASLCQFRRDTEEPSDPKAAAEYMKEIEARAPDDILSEVTIIRKGYEDIAKRPHDRLVIGSSIADAENEYAWWYPKNCQ